MNQNYIDILEYKRKFEEIRLKPIKDMTKEDALEVFLSLINVADFFPAGYSHTIRAYEILKGDLKK